MAEEAFLRQRAVESRSLLSAFSEEFVETSRQPAFSVTKCYLYLILSVHISIYYFPNDLHTFIQI